MAKPLIAPFIQRKNEPTQAAYIEEILPALRSEGKPLPQAVKNFFEPRFGQDFSKVRLHTNTSAAQAARSVNARAFTMGQDVVLGEGEYSPGTSEGKRLLAHELTHVVQQNGSESNEIQRDELPRLGPVGYVVPPHIPPPPVPSVHERAAGCARTAR